VTPAHFLIGEGLATIPTGSEPTRQILAKEFRLQQNCLTITGNGQEYLLELRNFHDVQRPLGKTTKLRLGDVVVIQEDIRPKRL
jgi:hypothetical protein